MAASTGRPRASRIDSSEVPGCSGLGRSQDGRSPVVCGTPGNVVPAPTTLETLAKVPGLYTSPPALEADGARICLSRSSVPVEIAWMADLLAAH